MEGQYRCHPVSSREVPRKGALDPQEFRRDEGIVNPYKDEQDIQDKTRKFDLNNTKDFILKIVASLLDVVFVNPFVKLEGAE
jgi:hypothetical protein